MKIKSQKIEVAFQNYTIESRYCERLPQLLLFFYLITKKCIFLCFFFASNFFSFDNCICLLDIPITSISRIRRDWPVGWLHTRRFSITGKAAESHAGHAHRIALFDWLFILEYDEYILTIKTKVLFCAWFVFPSSVSQ